MTKSVNTLTIEDRIKYIVSKLKERGQVPEDAQEPNLNQITDKRFNPLMKAAFQEYERRRSAMMAVAAEHADISSFVAPVLYFGKDSASTKDPKSPAGLSGRVTKALTSDQISNAAEIRFVELLGLLFDDHLWEAIPQAERKKAGLKHPFTPLIRAYLNLPESIRPDVDQNGRPYRKGILPEGQLPSQPGTIYSQLKIAIPDTDPKLLLGKIEKPTDQLPLFAEAMEDHDIAIPLLILADEAGFHGLKQGRGTRLDKRILIFSVLEMPLDQRHPGQRYELRRSLRWWRDIIWPRRNGRSHYKKQTSGPALLSALDAVNIAGIVLPDGSKYRPIHVWKNPDLNNMDDEVIIEIRLPEGSDRGPAIDKQALVEAGTISDPAFDLQLGLAYLWDDAKRRNGGFRIYATRPEVLRNAQEYCTDTAGQEILVNGKPTTRWDTPDAVRTGRHERNPQADRVQVLSREKRWKMAFRRHRTQISKTQKSNEMKKTDQLFSTLEDIGQIMIERDVIDPRTGEQGWRILEAWPH